MPSLDEPCRDGASFYALLEDARVPLDELSRALDAMETRVRALGDSARSVHRARHRLARMLGDAAAAQREFELWLAAGRDLSGDCLACEQGDAGDWFAGRGEDSQAFEFWDPVLDGSVFCDAEPHAAVARSLLPLVRLGQPQRARTGHVQGYRISRLKPALCAEIGMHIEFCALTGNAVRGLELLAEHAHWLPAWLPAGGSGSAQQAPVARRAGFLGGVSVLLRLLVDGGHEETPFAIAGVGVVPLGELRQRVERELSWVAACFDERNGNAAFSTGLLQRRSRQPFLSALPLDARTVLPRAALPRAGRRLEAPGPRSAKRAVADLVAEARRLTELWHPDALEAWRRARDAARAGGRQLPEDAQVELDEQELLAAGGAAKPVVVGRPAGEAAGTASVAAVVQRAKLLAICERYRAQGRTGPALRAAGRAAFALLRSGQVDAAASDQAALRAAAAEALAGRELNPAQYLAVRIGDAYQSFYLWCREAAEVTARNAAQPPQKAADQAWAATGERAEPSAEDDASPSPWFRVGKTRRHGVASAVAGRGADVGSAAAQDRFGRAARAALAELRDVFDEAGGYGECLHAAAAAGMAAQVHIGLGDTGAAETSLRHCAELFRRGGAPWCATAAELALSRLALARGEPSAAERHARAAVEHNLEPELRGPAAMALAEALWLQPGRETEAAAPALAAAAAFSAQQAGDDEARAQLRAAESLAVAGRAAEAIALFETALPALSRHWEEADWKALLAQAARAHGNCLIAVGEPWRGAELLLETAERVSHWPNQAPHALLAADAAIALEHAGRPDDAVAAFERAAQLWREVGDLPARVKCLRSAAWLLAADSLERALALMDLAGGELVAALSAQCPAPFHAGTRYELAETHLQRARIVLNMAESRQLAAADSDRLLRQAHQHAAAAISALTRLLTGASGTAGARPETPAQPTGPTSTSTEPDTLLLERLAVAAIAAARIESGYLDRPQPAAVRLRELAARFESWSRPDLALRLTERAERLRPTALAAAVPEAAAPSSAPAALTAA
jgi:tetratricopeptide (TPR) repeat protein